MNQILIIRQFPIEALQFRKLHMYALQTYFCNLVTSKPEDGWSGHSKHTFKYATLCQPYSPFHFSRAQVNFLLPYWHKIDFFTSLNYFFKIITEANVMEKSRHFSVIS